MEKRKEKHPSEMTTQELMALMVYEKMLGFPSTYLKHWKKTRGLEETK